MSLATASLPAPLVRVEPLLAAWSVPRGARPAASEAFRRELGLPLDRPLIWTGHQPGVWHAGIVAKYLAAEAAARRLGAGVVWLVADQDEAEVGTLRVPAHAAGGRLVERTVRVLAGEGERAEAAGVPPASRPASAASAEDIDPGIHPHHRGVVARVRQALSQHAEAGARTLAEQAARANAALLQERLGLPERPMVFASWLAGTAAFATLVRAMIDDPAACVGAYNDAAREHEAADVRPLRADASRVELPLWRLAPGRARRPVFASEAAGVPPAELAPRALLLDAAVRLFGADLFIHGVGGGAYTRATERWLAGWPAGAGAAGAAPARTAVVTATLLLDPDLCARPEPAASSADAARAAWRAHAARHHPRLLGDAPRQRLRDELVAQIAAMPPRSAERAAAYARLQTLLEDSRAAHGEGIDALRRTALDVRAASADAALAEDRTWAWPLHSDAALKRLADAVNAAGGDA